MMEQQIILAGFGGQGILSLGKFMCFAGMKKDWNVSWLPSYGPEVRGGTANCHVILSENEIASPIICRATAIIAFNEPSLVKFEGEAAEGAAILVNSSLVERKVSRTDVMAYYIPANHLAQEAGSIKCLNVVMLGAYAALISPELTETLQDVLKDAFAKKQKVYEMNQKAFALGEAYGRQLQQERG